MRLPQLGRRRFSALLSPTGAWAVEYRRRGRRLDVADARAATFDEPCDARTAAGRLADLLDEMASGRRVELALAIRGFDGSHNLLELPPAERELLRPVVLRELKRLYPDLDDPAFDFLRSGPPDAGTARAGAPSGEVPSEAREVRVGAVPGEVMRALHGRLSDRGVRVTHVTVAPEAIQRFFTGFVDSPDTVGLLFLLPGAPLLAFFHRGRLGIFRSPPVDTRADVDALVDAIAEEVKRGATFMRQRFRGAAVDRLLLAAEPASGAVTPAPDPAAEPDEAGPERSAQRQELPSALRERLPVRTERLDAGGMEPGELIALGAALDAAAGGMNLLPKRLRPGRDPERLTRGLVAASAALVIASAGLWAWSGVRGADAAHVRYETARQELERRIAPLNRMRPVIEERRDHEARLEFRRSLQRERAGLQQALQGVALASPDAVRLDSIRVARAGDEWRARLGGRAEGRSSAAAAYAVDRFYRALPERVPVRDPSLLRFEAAPRDTAAGPAAPVAISFEMSFIIDLAGMEAGS